MLWDILFWPALGLVLPLSGFPAVWVHLGLGNQLARVEARAAIDAFARATHHVQIEVGAATRSESFFRVPGSFPVSFR